MSAMSDTGDLGTIVNFLRSSFAIKTAEELCSEICTTLSAFGLNACAHIYLDTTSVYTGTDGAPSELEVNLIDGLFLAPDRLLPLAIACC